MRNRNYFLILLLIGGFLYACGDQPQDADEANIEEREETVEEKLPEDDRGIGEVEDVELNDPLDMSMVQDGKAIYEMKCASCHKLSDQRVVGPGFKGITDKRTPEWVMNMITNVEVMLAEDPEAQKLLEECLVRMPDQNVSVGDARDILEFMYYNDGKNIPEGAEL